MSADIVVTVGTDHHRFDRLVSWIDTWAVRHPETSVLVQHGTATAPAHAEAMAMLGYEELVSAMASARVVVAQGGPATVMDARSVGHRPVVVPRVARLDEVVDDHQVTFARWAAERGLVLVAEHEAELHGVLDAALVDASLVRIPPEAGATETTLRAFRAVVDPLLDQARTRRRSSEIRR